MKTKTYQFLKRVSIIESKIIAKQNTIEKLEASLGATAIRYDKDNVISSVKNDRMIDVTADILELENEIYQLQLDGIKAIKEIDALISSLPNPEWIKVMSMRYINNKPFSDIAASIDYSIDHTYTMHRLAGKWIDENCYLDV